MVSIKVQEATVRTAAVEIKALTVNGKQVTMGLFRQLKNEPLVDIETGLLRGVPWGTVNYFFGSCSADHSHIVWQSGDELRRSCELWTHPRRVAPTIADQINAWEDCITADVHAYLWWLWLYGDKEELLSIFNADMVAIDTPSYHVTRSLPPFRSITPFNECRCEYPAIRVSRYASGEWAYVSGEWAYVSMPYEASAKQLLGDTSQEKLLANMEVSCRAKDTLRREQESIAGTYSKTNESLRQLPQLFIAV